MDVAQSLEELRGFDGNLHCNTRLIARDGKAGRPKRRAAAFRPGSLIKAGFDQTRGGTARVARIGDKRKGGVMPFPTFREKGNLGDEGVPVPLRGGVGFVEVFASPVCLAPPSSNPPPQGGREQTRAHSCSWRFSDSTSSDSAASFATRASILRTACSTVVWSRPPNRRPISGSERSVRVFARYIATWRGRTTLAVRREDNRSERLTLYCRATTR